MGIQVRTVLGTARCDEASGVAHALISHVLAAKFVRDETKEQRLVDTTGH